MNDSTVSIVEGSAIPLRGNDIDTDRIIPARYLRQITFEGLGDHAFEDDRKTEGHPFENPRYAGASLLLVNGNFGCGSSREHAPQALMRWGIQGIVGESFAEIFQGNCTAMGVPCVTLASNEMALLMESVEQDPTRQLRLDFARNRLTDGEQEYEIAISAGNRVQLLEGAWDATGMLLEAAEEVRAVAAGLPYVKGFQNG